MYSRKQNIIPILLSTFIIFICIITVILETSQIKEAILTSTAVIGAISIWFEMKRSKDMAEGEFITNLNESFLSNSDVKIIYKKLSDNEILDKDDKSSIVEYLTFFETIFILIERNVIDINIVDDLFSYRFFIAINNKYIQEYELVKDDKYYKNIYTLDYIWTEYRKNNGLEINELNSLRNANSNYYDMIKEKYKKNGRVMKIGRKISQEN